mgnify:CR=1 FL=1
MAPLQSFSKELVSIAKEIKLIALDVDGVLTDGSLYFDDDGNVEISFNVKDGYGIVSLRKKYGIETIIISGRSSNALLHRIAELNISRFWVNQPNKLEAINIIIQEGVIKPNQILYVGDDIPDLEVIENVGLFVAVQDAHEMVKEKAHWITNASGGQGAVREVCDLVRYSIENNVYD